jgi:hypothetical protein
VVSTYHVRRFWMPFPLVPLGHDHVLPSHRVHPGVGSTCSVRAACLCPPGRPGGVLGVPHAGAAALVGLGMKLEPMRGLLLLWRVLWWPSASQP